LCNGHALFLPFSVWIVVAMYVIFGLLTRKTAFGLFIESVGNNERASRYAGIEARRIKWLTYVICGFCAGMAGLLAATNIKCADSNNAGLNLELDAILATVIGGTSMAGGRFFLSGSLVGAILIQTLTTTMYMKNVSPAIVAVPKAMVVIIVCLLQSPVFRAKVLSIFASKAAKGGVQ
ncbi:MAG: ABC transporter permease, partial [Lentisphaeria bacterium]|nr:ABC transporter permease [Lentisphaeria bacterium]